MRFVASLSLAAFVAFSARAQAPAPAPSKDRMLVIDFGATLGADSELAKLVQDIFLARVHAIGQHDLVSMSDVAQMLSIEQQRQLVGCDQGNCLADIGGALGARWVVTGTISLLGGRSVLSLKLVDTQAAKVDNQITKEMPVDDAQLAEAVRVASYELLRMVPPPPEEDSPWYKKWWVWGAAGAVVSGVALTYLLTRQEDIPETGLGTTVLDE
jgi:hypothetical protein